MNNPDREIVNKPSFRLRPADVTICWQRPSLPLEERIAIGRKATRFGRVFLSVDFLLKFLTPARTGCLTKLLIEHARSVPVFMLVLLTVPLFLWILWPIQPVTTLLMGVAMTLMTMTALAASLPFRTFDSWLSQCSEAYRKQQIDEAPTRRSAPGKLQNRSVGDPIHGQLT